MTQHSSFTRWLGLLLLVGVAGGCSGRVKVVDPAGRPIPDVRVAPVTDSVNGAWELTDAQGEASVPLQVGPQETRWVQLEKSGFNPVHVPVPQQWPLHVTMTPVGTSPGGTQLTPQP